MQAKADTALTTCLPAINKALDVLGEKVAVLQMMRPTLAGLANEVFLARSRVRGDVATSETALETSLAAMHGAVRELWSAANPD